MRESELERKFCRLVGQSGGKAYKFTSPGNSGVPDRLVVLPEGRIGFVELKQGGETAGKTTAVSNGRAGKTRMLHRRSGQHGERGDGY